MDIEKRIPVLVKVQDEIVFGNKSFYEPKIVRCINCGGNLFYIGEYYGLHKKEWSLWIDDIKVLGETPESKKYRKWEITVVGEKKYCAVCGCGCGYITVWDETQIAHEFDDEYERENYEQALDLLKYPSQPQQESLIRYDNFIKDLKKWISDWEKKQKEKKKKNK